jgi:hypothetical protein
MDPKKTLGRGEIPPHGGPPEEIRIGEHLKEREKRFKLRKKKRGRGPQSTIQWEIWLPMMLKKLKGKF